MPQSNESKRDENQGGKPERPTTAKKRIGLLLIVLSVVLSFGAFSLLYLSTNRPGEWTQFWVPTVVNVLLLVVVGLQSFIYAKQAQSMERAIEEARISREIENRAFVAPHDIETAQTLSDAARVGKLTIKLGFMNVGKTTALRMRVTVGDGFYDMAHAKRAPLATAKDGDHSYGYLLPGIPMPNTATVPMSTKELAEAGRAGEMFFFWGEVVYDDIFSHPRKTKFCFFLPSFEKTGPFLSCTHPEHNTVE